jgi:hypothetical protein
MMKSPNVPNKLCSELSFGFEYFKFSVCFGFRYSDFEFREELCILDFRLVHSICKDFINLKKYLVSSPSSRGAVSVGLAQRLNHQFPTRSVHALTVSQIIRGGRYNLSCEWKRQVRYGECKWDRLLFAGHAFRKAMNLPLQTSLHIKTLSRLADQGERQPSIRPSFTQSCRGINGALGRLSRRSGNTSLAPTML